MPYTVIDDTFSRAAYPSDPSVVAPASPNGAYVDTPNGTWSITGAGVLVYTGGFVSTPSYLARPFDEASSKQKVTLTYTYKGGRTGMAFRVPVGGLGGYEVYLDSGFLFLVSRNADGTSAQAFNSIPSSVSLASNDVIVITATCLANGADTDVAATITVNGGGGFSVTKTFTGARAAGSAAVVATLAGDEISEFKYEELVTLTNLEILTGTVAGTPTTNTFTLNRTADTGKLPIRVACLESTTVPGQWLPGNTAGQSSAAWSVTDQAGAAAISYSTAVPSSGDKYVKMRVYDATGRNIICPEPSGGSGSAPPPTFGKVTSDTAEFWSWMFFTVGEWQSPINVVRVGDSTTSMSKSAEYDSDDEFGRRLRDLLGVPPANVSVANIGVSGTTSQSWQKSGGSGAYSGIIPAFVVGTTNVVSLMLGLNDVRAGTHAGLAGRINQLCADILADAATAGHTGTIIVVHSLTPRPFYNGASDYQRWFDAVADIRDNVTYSATVRRGSTLHADELAQRFLMLDEVHLTAEGDELLADYQARAIAAILTGGWDGSGIGVGIGLL